MNIYDLSEEKQRLIDILYFCEDDEQTQKALENIQQKLDKKINFLADIVAELEDQTEIKKAARDLAYERLDSQYKQSLKAYERTKKYLLDSMLVTNTLKADGEIAKFSLCRRQDINIDAVEINEDNYPDSCFKPELTLEERLLKSKAKQFIKDNFDMYKEQGAYLFDNYYLKG